MSTLFLSGHMGSSTETASPLAVGLQLADEERGEPEGAWLTVQDLLARGELDFPVPERVAVCACSSLGLFEVPSDGQESGRVPSRFQSAIAEWTGFSAALVVGGARYVIATQFDQVDLPEATALDHAMANVLVTAKEPVAGFNQVVRTELQAWRNGHASMAILPMCYAIVAN